MFYTEWSDRIVKLSIIIDLKTHFEFSSIFYFWFYKLLHFSLNLLKYLTS